MKQVILLALSVLAYPKSAPTVTSGTPAVADGESVDFVFTGTDKDGAGDISRVYWLIAPRPEILTKGCHGFYDRPSDRFWLYDDALAYTIGPLAPGTQGFVANGQCAVYGARSRATASGDTLAVTVSLRITPAYGATGQNVYAWVKDKAGKETGWVQTGTWNPIPQPNPPPQQSTMRELDQYFELTSSLNQWVTLDHTPARDTLIYAWFVGKSGAQSWQPIRPRVDFDNPRDVEIITGEPGKLTLVYKTLEP